MKNFQENGVVIIDRFLFFIPKTYFEEINFTDYRQVFPRKSLLTFGYLKHGTKVSRTFILKTCGLKPLRSLRKLRSRASHFYGVIPH
jgi:hypothetical protein